MFRILLRISEKETYYKKFHLFFFSLLLALAKNSKIREDYACHSLFTSTWILTTTNQVGRFYPSAFFCLLLFFFFFSRHHRYIIYISFFHNFHVYIASPIKIYIGGDIKFIDFFFVNTCFQAQTKSWVWSVLLGSIRNPSAIILFFERENFLFFTPIFSV